MSYSDTVVTALYDYVARDSDELSIWKGESLVAVESYDDGWLLARNGENEGLIPSNYVSEINEINSSVEEKGEGGHVKGAVKRHKPSAEIVELNTLREEAEQKINALRYYQLSLSYGYLLMFIFFIMLVWQSRKHKLRNRNCLS